MENDLKSSEPHLSDANKLATPESVNTALCELFSSAGHRLWVCATRLNFPFFASKELLDSLKPLITGDQRNQIRFLISDDYHLFHSNPRLIELARKFSSCIHVRKKSDDYVLLEDFFVIVDNVAYLHMQTEHAYPASIDSSAPARVQQLANRFQQAWERSEKIVELSTLGL